ncbi:MAG: glycoside hydrolase family 2, partial [Clostridia bacterium]|nr:glycoside hydrolase family 2 [Clostridia bacterium]
IAEVSLNGELIGKHTGGYTPFSFDITEKISNNNTLNVIVSDNLDKSIPYGKQCKKRGGMWYTPISGIWQSVWLEALPEKHIESIRIHPSLSSLILEVKGGEEEKRIIIDGVGEFCFTGKKAEIEIPNPENWTPENPKLYSFTLISGEDLIKSYFALRTVTVEKHKGIPYICLNSKPYYFHGLLDQGYFADGIYTPASPVGYINDIQTAKNLGFNMLRKHIKTEPGLFYYYCDKYGMAVFQDMINNGSYNFLLDTALPTVGIKKGLLRPASKRRKAQFERSSKEITEMLYNHPCVCQYTIFNEGWGQYDTKRLYIEFKELDPSRIYDSASGWFKTKHNDVISEHIYFKKLNIKTHPEKPLTLSEFGGYSCKINENSFNLDKTYGYKFFKERKELTSALEDLYRKELIPLIDKGLCASVLTQLSDVEDETNGLITYDRRVIKPDIKVMQDIANEIYDRFKKITE